MGDRRGVIRRPDLVGAIVVKAGAYSVTLDSARRRHLDDLALLASMLRAGDLRGPELSRSEKRYLRPAVAALRDLPALSDIAGAASGVERVARVVG